MRWAFVLVAAFLPSAAPAESSTDIVVTETSVARLSSFTDDTPEERAANLEEFKTWFRNIGGTAPKLNVIDTDARGFGVEADEEIQEGDELITIPINVVLCRRTLLDRQTSEMRGISPRARSALSRIANDHDALVLLLIRERALGDDSFVSSYIKLLPKRGLPVVSTLPDMRQKKWLDQHVYFRAKTEAWARFNRHKLLVDQLKILLDGHVEEENMEPFLSLEAFAWADGVVFSRAITVPREGKFLVPFADLMNFAPLTNAIGHKQGKKKHRIVGGSFLVMADRHTGPGQEVLKDYGDYDSELYFHSFGFVPTENPFDCVTIQLPAPYIVSPRRKLVAKLKAPLNPEACVRPDRPLTDKFISHLYLLSMTDEHAVECMERVDANIEEATRKKEEATRKKEECMKRVDATKEMCKNKEEGGNPEEGSTSCFSEEAGFTPDFAWKELLEIIRTQLEPDPKKKIPPKHDDASEALHVFAPRPSQVQELIARFVSSRQGLLRVLLESPPPPAAALEGENSSAPTQDKSAKDKSGKKDDHEALNNLIYESTKKYLGALRAAQDVGAHSCNQSFPEKIFALLHELHAELGGALSISGGGSAGESSNDATQCANKGEASVASEDAVADFNAWLAQKMQGQRSLRVRATQVPGLRLGVVATEAIAAEEVYLGVPPSAIMDRESAAKSDLGSALEEVRGIFGRGDAFHEVLLHLWYERYVKKDKSNWWPYLRLLPSVEDLGAPYFLPDLLLDAALRGSALLPLIRSQRQEMRTKYDQIMVPILDRVPFFQKMSTHVSYPQYEWASLILNSRSIWWAGERHLVPMLDFVNCRAVPIGAREDAASMRVHSTKADKDNFAVTQAPLPLAQGDQVFENYGQPNYVYFLYHGFILDVNPHDCLRWDFDGQTYCLDPTRGVDEKMIARVGESSGRNGRSVLLEDLFRRLQLYPKDGAPEDATGREAVAYAFAASEKRLLALLVAQLERADMETEEL